MTDETLGGIAIQKVSERADWINMLVYGYPGAGKTMLAGSADEVDSMSPVLFIDIEGGTKTIRKRFPTVDVVRVSNVFDDKGNLKKTAWQSLQDVYEGIRKKAAIEGSMPYKTIVIDSLTEGHKTSMESIMLQVQKKDPDRDPDIPAMRDWGKSSEQIRRFVRAFRDLPCHTIFTALEASTKDATTGAIQVHPSLPGKLALEIPGYLDEVLYLYSKPNKEAVARFLLSQPTGKHIAKDRSGNLPTTMEDPTMAKVAELVLDA